VEVIEGPAADTLATLYSVEVFDFVFIDADKTSHSTYLAVAKRLVCKGGVVVRFCSSFQSISEARY
jgi:predicted O-methyltransferase YrrM